MGDGSVFKNITAANLKEVFQSKQNKFIYFYRKSALNPEENDKVE